MVLEGVKVLEFATDISGPYCGKLLGDFGAEVIKVESPRGDPSRNHGPFPEKTSHPEKSSLFLYLNTSKKGVVLDLSHKEDLKQFEKLVCWADVLIDNHPAGYLENLGFGWECLQKINPGLVYTAITPYGLTGRRFGVKGGGADPDPCRGTGQFAARPFCRPQPATGKTRRQSGGLSGWHCGGACHPFSRDNPEADG